MTATALLASLHVTEVAHRMVRLNLYPGVLGGLARNLGLWASLNRDLELRVGVPHGLARRGPRVRPLAATDALS